MHTCRNVLLLQESKVRFDSDEAFKKIAYATVVKLQSYEPDVIQAWQLICSESHRGTWAEQVDSLKKVCMRGQMVSNGIFDGTGKESLL